MGAQDNVFENNSKKDAQGNDKNAAAPNGKGQPPTDATPDEVVPKPPRQPRPITITDIELENLKKELAECKDKYLRVLAESENARKRLQKEKQEMIQYAQQNIVVDFLNPIDHMENALKFTDQMSEDVKHWAVGFQMILSQFKDALAVNGVTPFVSVGKPFDPHRHEAIETIATTDFPPGIVVEESLRGYAMGERTIRPARVKVSKAPAPNAKEKVSGNNIEQSQSYQS
jgi:molecular chaperone GrpE